MFNVPRFFSIVSILGIGGRYSRDNAESGSGISVFYFPIFVNIIGMGAGPFVVAFFTDSVFHNEFLIKYSLVSLYLIGGIAVIIFSWLGMKSYPKALGKI